MARQQTARKLPDDTNSFAYKFARVIGWNEVRHTTNEIASALDTSASMLWVYMAPGKGNRISVPAQTWINKRIEKIKTFRPDLWEAHGQSLVDHIATLTPRGGAQKKPISEQDNVFGAPFAAVTGWNNPGKSGADIARHIDIAYPALHAYINNTKTAKRPNGQRPTQAWILENWEKIKTVDQEAWESNALTFARACNTLPIKSRQAGGGGTPTNFTEKVENEFKLVAGEIFSRIEAAPASVSAETWRKLCQGNPSIAYETYRNAATSFINSPAQSDLQPDDIQRLTRIFALQRAAP